MTILTALDSFKGALSSREAGETVRRGVLRRIPDARVRVFPVGDGGEGTADAILSALEAKRGTVTVSDTHGFPVEAEYGILTRGGMKTAFFDMAAAAGLRFSKAHGLDLLRSGTRGVGELIECALARGCGEIVVGLGGSGTGDGGIGALAALGARFYDENGEEISDPRTGDLHRVARADLSPARERLASVRLTLLYDTDVPLTGERGAVRMYARQKGAEEEMLPRLEEAMLRFSEICDAALGSPASAEAGAGAAGGLGYGLTLAGGILTPGAAYVLDVTGFREAAASADCVFTGEGRTDAQTATGKLPLAVARTVRDVGNACPVLCLCGIDDAPGSLYDGGIDAVLALADRPMTAEESMEKTAELLEKAGFNLAGLIRRSV